MGGYCIIKSKQCGNTEEQIAKFIRTNDTGWWQVMLLHRGLPGITADDFFGDPKMMDLVATNLDRACATLNSISRDRSILFVNNKYVVQAIWTIEQALGLAVSRHDQKPMGWGELQEIKNDLVGHDRWAHQLFPAEDEKLDRANRYHLFVYPRNAKPRGRLTTPDGTPIAHLAKDDQIIGFDLSGKKPTLNKWEQRLVDAIDNTV